MKQLVPVLDFLMRFGFFRKYVFSAFRKPIVVDLPLDKIMDDLKSQGYNHIAENFSSYSIVVNICLIRRETWQKPKNVQNVKP